MDVLMTECTGLWRRTLLVGAGGSPKLDQFGQALLGVE